jgi:hypothetical protein
MRSQLDLVQRQADNRHGLMQAGLIGVVLLTTTIFMVYSPAPLVVAAAGATLAAILALMWAKDGPSIFLLPCAFQWSEVAVKPILSAVQGVPLVELSEFGADLDQAALFGFAGVLSLALGLRLGLGRSFSGSLTAFRAFVATLQPKTVIVLSWILIGFGMIAEAAEPFSGAARQIVLAFVSVKLVGVFLLVFWSLHMRRGYFWPALVVISQIIVGMTGFFAEFRDTVLVAAIATLCARPSLRPASLILAVSAGAGILAIASFWSAYKPAYRAWVSAGTNAQVVERPMDERIDYLFDYASRFGPEEFGVGLDALLMRHSYIDYLDGTMKTVPILVPHEGGSRLTESVFHVFTPRILFPDKPPTENDSDVTRRYSGLNVTDDTSTSISIGYLGELYVDFGYFGALVAAGLIGVAITLGLRLAFPSSANTPALLACLVMVVWPLCAFGTALIKMMGGTIMGVLVMIVFAKWVLPRLIALSRSLALERRKRRVLYPTSR